MQQSQPDPVQRFYDGQGPAYAALRERGFLRWLTARDLRVLLELVEPAPGQTALDVGCGAGLHARVLTARGLRVTAVDRAPRMVDAVRPHVAEALLGDMETLDLRAPGLGQDAGAAPRTFDRVLCCGVLDFARDPGRCVANLARHVAPGGRLVLMVPRRSLGGLGYSLWHTGHGIRVRLYGAAELDRLAGDAGLTLRAHRRPFLHSLLSAWERPRG